MVARTRLNITLQVCYSCRNIYARISLRHKGRGHTILTSRELMSRELTSRNVCDNRNVRGVLAREITWRKQSDRSVNLRHRIQW